MRLSSNLNLNSNFKGNHKPVINVLTKPNVISKSTVQVGNSLGDFRVRDSKILNSKTSFATIGAASCIILALKGLKNNYMAHIAPELQTLTTVKNELQRKISEFLDKDKNDQPVAIIYGGWNSKNSDSSDLASVIVNLLEYNGIENITMITGKDKTSKRDSLAIVGDNIYLWNEDFNELFKNKDIEKLSKDEIEDILSEYYEVTELPENIEINVLEKPKIQTNKK